MPRCAYITIAADGLFKDLYVARWEAVVPLSVAPSLDTSHMSWRQACKSRWRIKCVVVLQRKGQTY